MREKFNGRREEGAMVVIGSVSSEQNRKLDSGRWKSRSNTRHLASYWLITIRTANRKTGSQRERKVEIKEKI